jgi:hypothetical protein
MIFFYLLLIIKFILFEKKFLYLKADKKHENLISNSTHSISNKNSTKSKSFNYYGTFERILFSAIKKKLNSIIINHK